MPQFLATPGTAASFDFFTNLITLISLPIHEFWQVEQSLRNRSVFAAGGQAAHRARFEKAVLVHEATHFIDATTSLWGLEYNARKTLATKLLQRGEECKDEYAQQMRVFMLNTAEIDAHKMFTKRHEAGVVLGNCEMKHEVVVDPIYGPLIFVMYFNNGTRIIDVPLSMLAMLEAHAYANQTLSMILDAEALLNDAEREKVLAQIEADYVATLNADSTVEYTMLLLLVNRGFSYLALKHRLRLLSVIVRMALNADAYQMSVFAQRIGMTFIPSEAAESTVWDMLRGASRAVFAFKSIILLHDILSDLAPHELAQVASGIESDCYSTVHGLMANAGKWDESCLASMEVDVSLGIIEQDGFLHDKIIIPESVRKNRARVERSTCADVFDQLWLPDAADPACKKRLGFPNRIAVDVTNAPSQRFTPFRRLSMHIEQQPQKRFFLQPLSEFERQNPSSASQSP